MNNILEKVGPKFKRNAPILDFENQFAEENMIELKSRGVYKALLPTSLGGGSVSYTDICYFLKDLAKCCPATALTLSMHQHQVVMMLNYHRSGNKKASNILNMVAENDTVLMSTGAGDWNHLNGTAQKVKDGFLINCQKRYCSGAQFSDVAIMNCLYKDEEVQKNIYFSISLKSQGVKIANDWNAMGMRASGSNTVTFNNVFVPESSIIDLNVYSKWPEHLNLFYTFALPLTLIPYVGIAEEINDKTIKLIQGKEYPNDHSLISLAKMNSHYQIVKMSFEKMVAQIKDMDVPANKATSVSVLQLKDLITVHGRYCAQFSMEALGVYSYTKNLNIERLYRDFMACTFHPLHSEKLNKILGQFLGKK